MKCNMILKLMLAAIVWVGNASAITQAQYAQKGLSNAPLSVRDFINKNRANDFRDVYELNKKRDELDAIIYKLPQSQKNAALDAQKQWYEQAYNVIGGYSTIKTDKNATEAELVASYAQLRHKADGAAKKDLGNRGYNAIIKELFEVNNAGLNNNSDHVKSVYSDVNSPLYKERMRVNGHIAYLYFQTAKEALDVLNDDNFVKAAFGQRRMFKNRTKIINEWTGKLETAGNNNDAITQLTNEDGTTKQKLVDEFKDYKSYMDEIFGEDIAKNIKELIVTNDYRNKNLTFSAFRSFDPHSLNASFEELVGKDGVIQMFLQAWTDYTKALSSNKTAKDEPLSNALQNVVDSIKSHVSIFANKNSLYEYLEKIAKEFNVGQMINIDGTQYDKDLQDVVNALAKQP